MNPITRPRFHRGAGFVIASAVAALVLAGANRSFAAATVANAALFNLTVAAGADSGAQPLPSGSGNPTLLTVYNRTANDGIRGIASIAIAYNTNAPQEINWTGTAGGVVVGGETSVPGTDLGDLGVAVNIISDNTGGILNRFKIRNTSGVSVTVTVLEVW